MLPPVAAPRCTTLTYLQVTTATFAVAVIYLPPVQTVLRTTAREGLGARPADPGRGAVVANAVTRSPSAFHHAVVFACGN